MLTYADELCVLELQRLSSIKALLRLCEGSIQTLFDKLCMLALEKVEKEPPKSLSRALTEP
jgi:hypothetical protein